MRCTRCLFEAARSLRTDKLQTYILGEASPYVRPFNSPSPPSDKVKTSFRFFPRFFTPQESREVLTLALLTLDRRRRVRIPAPAPQRDDLQDLFRGEYPFEQAHFDSVIHNYRECLITKHPPAQPRARLELFERLYALLPEHKGITGVIPKGTYTHALHLAPEGKIDAHVDNLEASGSCIIGASLGGERILRLEKEGAGWEVLLPSGSVYVQQGPVRYEYKHSILGYDEEASQWEGRRLERLHRVSIMIRDELKRETLAGGERGFINKDGAEGGQGSK